MLDTDHDTPSKTISEIAATDELISRSFAYADDFVDLFQIRNKRPLHPNEYNRMTELATAKAAIELCLHAVEGFEDMPPPAAARIRRMFGSVLDMDRWEVISRNEVIDERQESKGDSPQGGGSRQFKVGRVLGQG